MSASSLKKVDGRRVILLLLLLALGAILAGVVACADADERKGWTIGQARSVTTIRGMHVRVVRCRGLGTGEGSEGDKRYLRFACEAGTRRPSDTYDTVGIQYEIHVRGTTGYVLDNVLFHGGPGIP